jgi:hypothetical protein
MKNTVMKKYRFERKGHRNIDTVLRDNTVDMIATKMSRAE